MSVTPPSGSTPQSAPTPTSTRHVVPSIFGTEEGSNSGSANSSEHGHTLVARRSALSLQSPSRRQVTSTIADAPSKLVSLATATTIVETDDAYSHIQFHPRPLPLPTIPPATLHTAAVGDQVDARPPPAAPAPAESPHARRLNLTGAALPAPSSHTPPKLLASLHSGFAYHHGGVGFTDSPASAPVALGSKPPSPRSESGGVWASKTESHSENHDRSHDGTNAPATNSASGSTASDGATAPNGASGPAPKRFKVRPRDTDPSVARERLVKVSHHAGGKVVTTISHAGGPSAHQPANSDDSEDDEDATAAAAGTTTTTTTTTVRKSKAKKLGAVASGTSPSADDGGTSSSSPEDDKPLLTRLRFRYIMFLLTVVQVAVVGACVWYLGYLTSLETGRVLANQARAAITHHVEDSVQNYASSVLQSADALAIMTALRNPTLTKLGGFSAAEAANYSLIDSPGFMTDLSYILSTFPSVPFVGLSTVNHIHLTARRNESLPGVHQYQIMDAKLSERWSATYPNTVYDFVYQRDVWYENRTDPENDPTIRSHASWFQPLTDFTETDDPLDMLGAPVSAIGPYNNTARPWFVKARALNNTQLAWSGSTTLIQSTHLGIAAFRPIRDSMGAFMTPPQPASGELSYLSYSLFYFDTIREILLGVQDDIGDSGSVFLVEGNGLLVATTLDGFDTEYITRTQVLTSPHKILWHIIDVIAGDGFFQIGVDPTDDDQTNEQMEWVAMEEFLRIHPNSDYTATDPLVFSSSEPVWLTDYPDGINAQNRHFVIGRTDYHVNAHTLNLPGLDWVIIVCTMDQDFDGGLGSNKVTTGWFTALVAVVAALVSLALAHCISRPLMRLVTFMENVSSKLHRKRGDTASDADHEHTTTEELSQMCHEWQDAMASLHRRRRGHSSRTASATSDLDSGSDMMSSEDDADSPDDGAVIDLNRRNSTSVASKIIDNTITALAPPNDVNADTNTNKTKGVTKRRTEVTLPKRSLRDRLTASYNRCAPACLREFPVRETQLLQLTFGSMLESLRRNHQQLQTANESKRRFIRYIFHEVRVPFNAIVLGVEQLREDLYTEPLRPVEEMQDVINILNDQSKVVARILNDVLSLQKIEDGALQLEMAPFNVVEMVFGTLRSFQPLFDEKRLQLVTDIQNIEECMAEHAQKAYHRAEKRRKEMEAAASAVALLAAATAPHSASNPSTQATLVGSSPTPQPEALDTDQAEEQDHVSPIAPLSPRGDGTRSSHARGNSYADGGLQQHALSHAHDVLGDRYRLRQVLANFLSNAVKFSPYSGTVTVSVTCRPVESAAEKAQRRARAQQRRAKKVAAATGATVDHTSLDIVDGDATSPPTNAVTAVGDTILHSGFQWTPPTHVMVRVAVHDTGRGLSFAEQQQMFLPYVQLSSGEQQQGKGTGLGLNISKSLIELHGGSIGVSSTGVSGQGCQFFFELPVEVVPAQNRSVSASPVVINTAAPAAMRAWHSPGMGLRSLSRAATSSSASPSGIPGVVNKTPMQRTFSLQQSMNGGGPMSLTARQRMLDRTHKSSLSLSDRHEFGLILAGNGGGSNDSPATERPAFSPLVGSSRRIASSRAHFSFGSAVGLTIPPPAADQTEPTVVALHPFPSSPSVPTLPTPPVLGQTHLPPITANVAHLNKLALLQGLANESSGYGFGYSSRGIGPTTQHLRITRDLPESGVLSPTSDGSDGMAPVLTPVDDDTEPAAGSTRDGATQPQPSASWALLPSHIRTPSVHSVSRSAGTLPPPVPGRDFSTYRSRAHYLEAELKIDYADAVRSFSDGSSAASSGQQTPMFPLPMPDTSPEANARRTEQLEASLHDVFPKTSTINSSPVHGSLRPRQSGPLPSQSPAPSIEPTSTELQEIKEMDERSHDSSRSTSSLGMHTTTTPATAPPSTAVAPVQPSDKAAESHGSAREQTVEMQPIPTLPPSSELGSRTNTTSTLPPSFTRSGTPAILSPSFGASVDASLVGDAESVNSSPPVAGRAISTTVIGTASTSAASSNTNSSQQTTPPSRPRILVVEDSAPNRKLLVMLLKALKCDVVGVENGLLAVQEFAPHATQSWVGDNIAGRAEAGGSVAPTANANDTDGVSTAQEASFLFSPVLSGLLSSPSGGSSILDPSCVSPSGIGGGDSPHLLPFQPAATRDVSAAPLPPNVQCNYDLVFIDGNMPVMDGIVATRNLRGLGITIPLIAVTGNAMEDDLHVFKSAGINRILTKPVQRAVLQATLKEYLPNFRPAVSAAEIKMKQRK